MFPLQMLMHFGKPTLRRRCFHLASLQNASESPKAQTTYQHIFDRSTKKLQRERSAKQ